MLVTVGTQQELLLAVKLLTSKANSEDTKPSLSDISCVGLGDVKVLEAREPQTSALRVLL